MLKRISLYLFHIFSTLIVLLIVGLIILLSEDGGIHYGDNPIKMTWDNDGPYVFYEGDSLLHVQYVHGKMDDGFYSTNDLYPIDSAFKSKSYFNLDSTSFSFYIDANAIQIPATKYSDDEPIFAVSDIESGYKTFRDLLLHNEIIDKDLEWNFGQGHLVLVGDFVDRGFSTTQTLWFIYKLEQEAQKVGGNVHFILGNHELKVMQANFEASSPKYAYLSYILKKQQHQLYNRQSFLGRWMSSKNSLELINGHLFVHGGIHPKVAQLNFDIDQMNEFLRSRYYDGYFKQQQESAEQLLTSTQTGPNWYRGYFKDETLTQKDVELGLDLFGAEAVVVGHTLQSKVNRSFNGIVIGIDVQHPNDYHKNWPKRSSEALLITDGKYFRVLADGEKIEI
jgi:calcineurin-like phosphoesterase family protein